MKHKKLFISLTAVITVLIFFGIFILIWFVGDSYKDFKKFNKEFAIEGLKDGAIPQGITSYNAQYPDYNDLDSSGTPKTKRQEYFLISAYMHDGSPSRIYVTGQQTGYVGFVTLKNLDGKYHYGHVGGIATNGDTLWVADGDSVAVVKADPDYSEENILRQIITKAQKNSDRENGEEIASIQFTASFKANCNVAFLFYSDDSRYLGQTYDRLYVGEFYRKGNYETDKSHQIKTPSGYKNTALMYEYDIDGSSKKDENPYGLVRLSNNYLTEENKVPQIKAIYSLPEKIQGIAFSRKTGYSTNDGMLVLSQSYGLSNSHLLCFDWAKVRANKAEYKELTGDDFVYDGVYYTTFGDDKVEYTSNKLPVYFVDKGDKDMLLNDYSIPSMSEGMCIVTPYGQNPEPTGRIYVLFESGSKKYSMFTRESIKHVYSFIPHKR